MKYIALLILIFSLSSSIFAYDGSKLRIQLGGNVNTKYLCVSQVGCVNIAAGVKGHVFPITPGTISYIFLADGRNYRMYPQALPSSCNVTLSNNQTLVVSGKVSRAANDNIYIENLRCLVANS